MNMKIMMIIIKGIRIITIIIIKVINGNIIIKIILIIAIMVNYNQ